VAPNSSLQVTTDTIMVRRANHYYVKNTTQSGFADYDFYFGDKQDTVLVGDWATPPVYGDDPATPAKETTYVVTSGRSGDYADALAVRRGNVYFESKEVQLANGPGTLYLGTQRSYAYGDPTDTAFSALLDYTYDDNGTPATLAGDGLAVRRNG
jgi:hypothetical protein